MATDPNEGLLLSDSKLASGMVTKVEGAYSISVRGGASLTGHYSFEQTAKTGGQLRDESGSVVGEFEYSTISETCPIQCFDWETEPHPNSPVAALPIEVVSSEIMKQIQTPDLQGLPCYFVLPSQLNGAEYPSNARIVRELQDYCHDNTGGPRGQLAVHPAAGQFVLDNAANDRNKTGINAVDTILAAVGGEGFELENGYLQLPRSDRGNPLSEERAQKLFGAFVENMHTLRPLVMHDVPACGLTPDKASLSAATHRVGLVYASAVPVEAYNNWAKSLPERKLYQKCAEAVLVAQYYGSLVKIAKRSEQNQIPLTKVYFLPLGGGVFNNSWISISRAMAQAVELLANRDPDLVCRVQVAALAWEGSPSEKATLEKHLGMFNKLLPEVPPGPPIHTTAISSESKALRAAREAADPTAKKQRPDQESTGGW